MTPSAIRRVADRLDVFGRRLTLVALGGLAWRVLYVLVWKQGDDVCGQPLCGDAIYYSGQANVLAHGHLFTHPFVDGAPAADHPPMTAVVAAPASLLPGDLVTWQRLTMALVGVAVVVAIGLLARRIGGDRVGLLAAGVAAVYPNLWVNDALVMSESLTALAVAVVLLLTYRLHDDGLTPRLLVWTGITCGLAVLTRAELAMLVPITVFPVLRWRAGSWRSFLRPALVVAAVGVGVTAPWVVFNLSRFEEPVLLSTNDGLTLLGANCDEVYYGGGTGYWNLDCALRVPAEGDQSEVSATYRDLAFDYMGSHKRKVPSVVAIRVARAWSFYAPDQMVWLNQGEGRERSVSWAGFWTFHAGWMAAVAGAAALRRRRRLLWPLASTAIVVTITAALFYGIVRFRVPAEVAVVVLAAVALDALWSRLSPAPDPGAPAAATGVAA